MTGLSVSKETIAGLVLLAVMVGIAWYFIGGTPTAAPEGEICDLIDNNQNGEIDEGFPVTCESHTDCGGSFIFGEKYCKGDEVWTGQMDNTCRNEGTCLSECLSIQTEAKVKDCDNGCLRGRCRE